MRLDHFEELAEVIKVGKRKKKINTQLILYAIFVDLNTGKTFIRNFRF